MKRTSKVNPTWILVPFFVLLFIYARWIEPIWIEVTRHPIKANVDSRIKIAQLSDLHIRELGHRENKILSLLEAEAADAVVITGDAIAENGNYLALKQFLARIRAPRGIWMVNGNWEHWRPSEGFEIRDLPGVRFLNNSGQKLTTNLWIVGADDELAGQPDLSVALSQAPSHAFKIGLFHSPAFFEQITTEFDLSLAGHTHGGQVRLPFLPPLWLPEGSGPYIAGWYKKDAVKMYVSRGLGNSILDVRFFSRPELAIFEIGP